MSITQRLKKARLNAGLSQPELASKLGIPVRTYRSYEHGERSLSTSMLLDICKVLNVSSDYLLGRNPHEETKSILSPYKVAVAESRVNPKEAYKIKGVKRVGDYIGNLRFNSYKNESAVRFTTTIEEKNAAPVKTTLDGITKTLSELSDKDLDELETFIEFLRYRQGKRSQ